MFEVNYLLLSLLFCGALAVPEQYSGDATGRIVGGKDAPDGAFPFQVSMQLEPNGRHFCGGTIIANRWILTTAGCLENYSPNDITIYMGSNLKSTGGTRMKIEKLIKHEDFSTRPFLNDIALMRTSEKINFSDKIKPIEISSEDPKPGDICKIAGWGSTSKSNRNLRLPDKLQMLDVKVITEDKCRSGAWLKYEKLFPITANNTCTFNKKGEGTCLGDGGGSLVCHNKSYAISTLTVPCARGEPDVYTKCSRYRKWIMDTMEANKPQ